MSSIPLIAAWAACGIGGGIAGPVIVNKAAGGIRGYREARKNDHRGAYTPFDTSSVSLEVAGTGDCPSEELTPDLLEPIVGLRAWRVAYHGALVSYQNTYWPFREIIEAQCDPSHGLGLYGSRDTHAPPSKKCSCGIYAAKRELEIQAPAGQGPYAWGRVAIWGKVEESEKGYRAQYAYPISLVLVNDHHHGISTGMGGFTVSHSPTPPLSDDALEKLRHSLALHYGIPVRIGTADELQELRVGNYEAMGIPAEVKDMVG